MVTGVSSRSAESPIPMERDVSATGGNPTSEDEVPTSVSRGAKKTNENIPCESERPPVRYTNTPLVDIVNPDKLCANLCKGFDFTGGQNFHFFHRKLTSPL